MRMNESIVAISRHATRDNRKNRRNLFHSKMNSSRSESWDYGFNWTQKFTFLQQLQESSEIKTILNTNCALK
jgi:hypothetical protein